jgi:sugar (pentulose or hexulose) kinase
MGKYAAIDLGAESGRVIVGAYDGGRLKLEEIYRFQNIPVKKGNSLRWDIEMLWRETQTGLKKSFAKYNDIESIGIDTWGVDFILLDKQGEMVDLPYHYRDTRTDGIPERVYKKISAEELYLSTGIQNMQINTFIQLIALKEKEPEVFAKTGKILFIPDWFVYKLTGKMFNEYTISSTSQLMDISTGNRSKKLLDMFDIPEGLFSPLIRPGEIMGNITPGLTDKFDYKSIPVISVGSHDTASAVAGVPAGQHTNWAYLSSGTWSLMGIESDKALINQYSAQEQFTNEGGVNDTIRFLKNITGLWLLQECKRFWEKEGDPLNYEKIVKLAEQAKPFSALIDPGYPDFFSGGNIPGKIAEYLKKTGQNPIGGKGQTIRTILESLSLKYQSVMKRLEKITGTEIDVLHIVGGGCRNRLLNQMTANAAGKKVIAGPIEATVCGNILVQMVALKKIESIHYGREIIKNSFDCEEYFPQDKEEWENAGNKMKKLMSLISRMKKYDFKR